MRAALVLLLAAGCVPVSSGGLGGGGKPSEATGGGNTTSADTGETGDSSAPVVDTASLEGTGYQVGDVAYDLVDEGDETDETDDWHLYGEAGRPIVLVVGHMDSSATPLTLGALPDVDKDHPEALMAAMIGRDEYSTTADADDAERWQDDYGLERVLLNSSATDMALWSDNNPPKTYVIGPDMGIAWVGYGIVSQSDLSGALDEL